ncbi:transposable element Tcb1 transposase [Trichonephila clavipes]|nr:transposable element Tcb1 transposase [Trichonephila clavipes]
MYASSSSVNPTPLAHANTQRCSPYHKFREKKRKLAESPVESLWKVNSSPLQYHFQSSSLQHSNTSASGAAIASNIAGTKISDKSRFNLRDYGDRIRVRRYAVECCLPECVFERHSGLTPRVMVWDAILYHGRTNFIQIEGNLNSNRYGREVLQPEVVSFLQGIPGAIFQDNAQP